ncbi:MarR family winged helix-turn-helix transcriptional regulator [Amycolatopsis panacis]|uniref:MarR family transcriptional regulator n=1 Tax=Amycolatopsis panacis TaxID=2340917 RepID=A0A419I7U6_9PSEU|nr:MarR family transcriptional regulator [Amycolatopsis panacis]RJQ87834.1 MarR family transcriptional regulator [Amycolatopsis panacis]
MTTPPPTIRLGLLLRQAHRRAAAALNEALGPLGLTGRHFGVLLLIDRDGATTQRDLIRETGSDKAGMVRTVEDLERLGYLTRTRSATDRRVADLTLTPAGEEAFATARELAGKAAGELFGMFRAEETEALEDLLTRFLAVD